MDRLRFVHDTCHILNSPHHAWRSSSWHRAGMPPTVDFVNGFTDTVHASRFLCWRRHYTRDGKPPSPTHLALPQKKSLITIDEWIPGVWPLKKDAVHWKQFGNPTHHGIAHLSPEGDITQSWSTHAKRHLKTFYKNECSIREGTFADVTEDMLKSQVPRAMSLALAKIVEYRLAITPETITIFVAIDKTGKRIGCFVAGNDEEQKESMYIMGYFLPEAAKLQPMTGLVHAWLATLQHWGYTKGNFGLMVGPNVGRWDPWWGLSQFKTHFNITRTHLPPSRWKITLKK